MVVDEWINPQTAFDRSNHYTFAHCSTHTARFWAIIPFCWPQNSVSPYSYTTVYLGIIPVIGCCLLKHCLCRSRGVDTTYLISCIPRNIHGLHIDMFFCDLMPVSFTHIIHDPCIGDGVLLRLSRCKWSNPNDMVLINTQYNVHIAWIYCMSISSRTIINWFASDDNKMICTNLRRYTSVPGLLLPTVII